MPKNTYMLIELMSEPSARVVSNRSDMRKFERLVDRFIDTNNESLTANHFGERLIFDQGKHGEGRDSRPVFELTDVDPREIEKTLDRVRKTGVRFSSSMDYPLNWMLANWIRELDKHDNKRYREFYTEKTLMYMSFAWWWSLQIKYFKHKPQKGIVDYTVSRLSQKFKIKRFGNALDAVYDSVYTQYLNDIQRLREGSDENVKLFLNGQLSRMNSMFQKFRNEFEKDYRAGNYINVDDDQQAVKGDDGSPEIEASTYSTTIQNMTQRTVSRLLNENADQKAINVSSKINKVPASSLRSSIESMTSNYQEEYFYQLIIDMITLYVVEGQRSPRQIFSNDYLEYMLKLYRRSNTSDEGAIRIKKKLDEILTQVSPLYLKTNRATTKMNLRKSIFLYLAIQIQRANRSSL